MPRPPRRAKITFRFFPVSSIFAEQWLPHLTKRQILVFLALQHLTWGKHNDHDGIAYCQIAELTGLNERDVRRTIPELERDGLVRVIRKATRPNIYYTNTPWHDISPGGVKHPTQKPKGEGRITPPTGGVNHPTTLDIEKPPPVVMFPSTKTG